MSETQKPGEVDWFKALTGKSFDEATRIPSLEDTDNLLKTSLRSKHDVRTLGQGKTTLYLTEEEREANVHIIGAPSEGKSKFLEHSIRADIDAGIGLTLLDSSDGGKTSYDVLKYCASIGHEKVVLIDPRTLYDYGKIAALQLIDKYEKLSIDGIFESVNVLFNTKTTDTPRIKRHLGALLKVLSRSGLTISESSFFSSFGKESHKQIRKAIFNSLPPEHRDRTTLEDVFQTKLGFETYFYSTVNRLDMFWEEPLSIMFGADKGLSFTKMISEGWVILVNLAPGKYLTPVDAQLLGVLLISQLIKAADILLEAEPRGVYKKVHYLYIDEAGRFATPQIDTLLSYKRKAGIRLVIAHHYFNQFTNRQVLDSVKQNTRIKVMFNTPSYDDRLEMSRLLGYGGDIKPIDAAFNNQDLARQYAIIKKNKESPVRVRVPDVPEVKADLKPYIQKLLDKPWYVSREQVKQQRTDRIYKLKKTANSRTAGLGAETDSPPNSNPGVSKRKRGTQWKTISKDLQRGQQDAPENGGGQTS